PPSPPTAPPEAGTILKPFRALTFARRRRGDREVELGHPVSLTALFTDAIVLLWDEARTCRLDYKIGARRPRHATATLPQRGKQNERTCPGIFTPCRACRRTARSHDRCASHTDLSDHVIRLQRR